MTNHMNITFKKEKCPRCGKFGELMHSNNPLSGDTICFECIKSNLVHTNLEHADFFCRTYNLPFNPQLWIELVKTYDTDVYKEYSAIQFNDTNNQPNLYYSASTKDIWTRANREWEKCRSFAQILARIEPIKESYIERGRVKWGEQYTFEEIIKLDSVYSKTLKANNIINPIQKEAVKTLCKLQIQMDQAIREQDPKSIKDYASAYSTFAKQADLETMINDSKTDDITTVAELYQYMEDQGFIFKYHDGSNRDEVDQAISDIQEANRRLILESTGLEALLEEMIRKKTEMYEEQYTKQVVEDTTLKDLLNFTPQDGDIEVEDDEAALNTDFGSEEEE